MSQALTEGNFRYLRDPLFMGCVWAYVVNRLVLKPYFPTTFSYGYLNDLICVPFCLPVMLWGLRRMRLRPHDLPPQPLEVVLSLLVWVVAFEIVIPHMEMFKGKAFSDPADVLCYVLGALAACMIWKKMYPEEREQPSLLERGKSYAFP